MQGHGTIDECTLYSMLKVKEVTDRGLILETHFSKVEMCVNEQVLMVGCH